MFCLLVAIRSGTCDLLGREEKRKLTGGALALT